MMPVERDTRLPFTTHPLSPPLGGGPLLDVSAFDDHPLERPRPALASLQRGVIPAVPAAFLHDTIRLIEFPSILSVPPFLGHWLS
jgi:hypothetical protein